MRRRLVEQPISSSARWCLRAALLTWGVGLAALVMIRARAFDLFYGYGLLAGAILSAGAALMLAVVAACAIWRTGDRGLSAMFLGAFMSLAWLAIPGYFAVEAFRLPVINDISTDLADPPTFSMSQKALAARGGTVAPIASIVTRHVQQDNYPEVRPIVLEMELEEAYGLTLKAVRAQKWEIVDATPPRAPRQSAQIDAIQNSFFLRSPDDIVVRLTSARGQTKVDLRSVSRFGRHDFGQNAKRAEAFIQALQDQLDAR